MKKSLLILYILVIALGLQAQTDTVPKVKNTPTNSGNVYIKSAVEDTGKKTQPVSSRPGPVATGKVVHRDNQNCPLVIEVINAAKKDTLYYLPMGYDLKSFDKKGTTITFKYRRLMIKQPTGCSGIPVQIWDVQKVMKAPKKEKIK